MRARLERSDNIWNELHVLATYLGHLTMGRIYRAEECKFSDAWDVALDAGASTFEAMHCAREALMKDGPRVS